MSKLTILGVNLEFEFLDADELERYQTANQRVAERFNAISYDSLSAPDSLREQCKIINEFFDDMFGEGTSEKLFKGKNNIKQHLDAFADVTNAALESDNELNALATAANRYSPNRAQRNGYDSGQRGNGQTYHNPGKKKRYN